MRLLTSAAMMTAGTLVAGALGNIGASVFGGIFANDLGDIAKGLGENEEILNDRELT